jgi:AraC-like DNA-binding protein
MACSSTALFSEPEAFEAAFATAGGLRLTLAGPDRFRARLTLLAAGPMRLATIEESQPRIAVLAVAADTTLITLPLGRSPAPGWGGLASLPGEIMTHGRRVPGRTQGGCRWGAIWMPTRELARYGRAIAGDPLNLPPGTQPWQPPAGPFRTLRALHAAAIATARTEPAALIHAEAAHGLQQQVIHALVGCLSGGAPAGDTPGLRRHQDIALRFDDLLCAQPDGPHSPGSASTALGVSRRSLDAACREQLGMGPAGYIRLHRLHRARQALRRGKEGETEIAEIARRFGFADPDRFSRSYRDLFGEMPSTTLSRGSPQSEGSG